MSTTQIERWAATRRWIVAILSALIALAAYRFLILGLDVAFEGIPEHLTQRRNWFWMHVSAAPVALLLGSIQLFPKLRARRLGLHRWLGRIYGIAVLIAGVSGLVLAIGAAERPVAAVGFGLLSVFWLFTTARAILHARNGEVTLHRRWIMRSFAFTFAAVTLRLFIPVLFMFGYESYAQMSPVLAWLCWVPNLLVVEWILHRKGWR